MPPWPYRAELYDSQDPTDFLIGMLVPLADYWPRVREAVDRHSILHTVGAARCDA
jgi:putrescine aminotransferase